MNSMNKMKNSKGNVQQQRGRGRGRGRRSNTLMGSQAISKIVRTSDNILQAGGRFISNRYSGPKAMTNIAADLSLLKMVVNSEEKQILR